MTESTIQTYPIILGKVPVSKDFDKGKQNKAIKSREILNNLSEGEATLIEFADKKEAIDYRSMLYTMAILKYGEAGRIGTKVTDNIMYVWLTSGNEVTPTV